ncbi:hypothetical protein PACTADRAFT_41131 [Pachysolen tannophilus NRRL Y-2460]|uniref:Urea active transporter n=1 Tax=Pachysolen tannophilus NRRL Y-2460 TaxID=669874 RepID=A0A1E4TX24_PACTA|nr:hypothetical protein PACTADRAFT_41131 [Pachysolen tannophilus NRRL Y-2460]
MSSETTTIELLNQGSGYGVLVGIGTLFALGVWVATKLMSRYLGENLHSTEQWMLSNRSVGVALTASATFSSWFWATETLWVVTMVYSYGIMASFWYGAGLSVHICIMAVIGIEAKKKIPNGHTSLEIVKLRYGKACHILYLFLCLSTNLLSSSSMILGAAGAISVIAGNMNIAASTMLIPVGVLMYTTFGGLRATFLTDYIHSIIALIILCYFNTAVLTSSEIGGIDSLYDMVIENKSGRSIEGNFEGSFLTGKSKGSIYFGIIHAIGDFGLTIMDSSFWQKSFSASIRASVPGYLIAAVAIFAIVWPLGTIVGLANVVLESSKIFPTYPRTMTTDEIDSGYGLPYTLKAVLGKNSLAGLLLVIYLAVTSTVSAQMISVSSIMSFDIYKSYINKDAQNHQLIRLSHFGVVFFGLFSAGFSLMLHYVGVNMTWFGYFYSMIICPGVIPLLFAITWDKQTKLAFFVSPIIGMAAGIATWLSTAYKFYGVISITSTGGQLPCLYGGLVALFLPGLISVILSLADRNYKFDWSILQQASLVTPEDDVEENKEKKSSSSNSSLAEDQGNSNYGGVTEKISPDVQIIETDPELLNSIESQEAQENQRIINLYIKIAYGAALAVFLITWVVWPLPLYRDYIFGKAFFRGWTTMSLIWVYAALLAIGVYPLYDGRSSLYRISNGFYKEFIKREKKKTENL